MVRGSILPFGLIRKYKISYFIGDSSVVEEREKKKEKKKEKKRKEKKKESDVEEREYKGKKERKTRENASFFF